MAEGQDDTQEKTEEPTAKRLSKAREEGQLARSQETTIAASKALPIMSRATA